MAAGGGGDAAAPPVSQALIKLVHQAKTTIDPDDIANAGGLAGELEFSDFFSVRRPKHVFAGISSGMQSATKGTVSGALCLMGVPALGAYAGGFSGFLGGLLAGAVGGIVLPVVGVSVGATQVVRGVVATPESVYEPLRGKRWDSVAREWVFEDLEAEALEIPASDDDIMGAMEARRQQLAQFFGGSASGTGAPFGAFPDGAAGPFGLPGPFGPGGGGVGARVAGAPKETAYYELLEVAPQATPNEIKKSYYTLARKLHPDKNPGDPAAASRFQELGAAYQVLQDPELRKRYDTQGAAGVRDVPILDATAFFNMLFGSDYFNHLIGRLELATAAAAGFGLSRVEMRTLQRRRVSRLAQRLAMQLSGWVEAKDDAQRSALAEAARIEATALAEVSFGGPMLHAIGYVYVNKADQFLGNPLVCGSFADVVSPAPYSSMWAAAEQKLHVIGTHCELGWAGVQAFLAAKAVADAEAAAEEEREAAGEPPRDKADVMAKVSDLLPNFVEALWRHTVLDIESTSRQVASKVLWDRASCTDSARLRARATALRRLGKIFTEVVAPAPRSPAQLVEEALRAAIFASAEDDGDEGGGTPHAPGTPEDNAGERRSGRPKTE